MTPKLLIDEPPIAFLPTLAREIGVNEAIALQQIHYLSRPRRRGEDDGEPRWVQMPIAAGKRRDGRRPLPSWADEFPFWSPKTIHRTFRRLRLEGWIDVEIVPVAEGLGREARIRVAYGAIESLEQRLQSGHSDQTGRVNVTRPREVNVTRLPSFNGGRTTTGEEKPASQSSPSTVLDDDRDEVMEQRLRDSIVLVLAEQLAGAMVANNPRARVAPRSRAWLDPIRLMIERDGYSPNEVRAMILWSQANDFERGVVLSPRSLRRGVERIVAKMARAGVPPFGRARAAVSAGDLVDALTGAVA